MIYTSQTTRESGYTLLFAVLISSIVLGVAISILSISRKEFILSTSARESQYAFYAADSGLECAAFQDLDAGHLSFSGTSTEPFDIHCGVITASVLPTASGGTPDQPASTTFAFNFQIGAGNACTAVKVSKDYTYENILIGTSTALKTTSFTTIVAKGYNIGWDDTPKDCSKGSTKKVERQLRLTH